MTDEEIKDLLKEFLEEIRIKESERAEKNNFLEDENDPFLPPTQEELLFGFGKKILSTYWAWTH